MYAIKRRRNQMIGKYMTTKEAAEVWGVEQRTVLAWINRNKLPSAQKIGRDWMIPKDTPKPVDRRYVENPIRNRRKNRNE